VDDYHAYRSAEKALDWVRNEEVAVLEQYEIPPFIHGEGEVSDEEITNGDDGESIALRPVVWEGTNVS
jgi:hypothetical protein